MTQMDELNELMREALELKERGNAAFKENELYKALNEYSEALRLLKSKENKELLSTLHRNVALCHFRLDDFESCLSSCDAALELIDNDPKTLFRKALALEQLERVELAYKEARRVHQLDANNKAVQPLLHRLHAKFNQKLESLNERETKVRSSVDLVFDASASVEKRRVAADNLIVLAKDRVTADLLVDDKFSVVHKAAQLMKVEMDKPIKLSIIRCVGELCRRGSSNVRQVLKECGIAFFLDALNASDNEIVTAVSVVIQAMLDTLSDAETGKKCKEIRKNVRSVSTEERKWGLQQEAIRVQNIKNSKELDSIFLVLLHNVNSRVLSGLARDAIIELLTRNCRYDELNWADKLLDTKDGYERLMEVAAEMKEIRHESSMNITDDTRTLVGVCFAYCYDSFDTDAKRNSASASIESFINSMLSNPTRENSIKCVAAITTLLRNAPELGQPLLAKEGILPMMLTMAKDDEDSVQQLVAAEALIAAASKKKDSSLIVSQGLDILKQLYKAKDEHIKVRALVGLCKLGASAGHDASLRPFQDGSTSKLSDACRRFLINPGQDRDLKKWAAEGLSYLTLDADVKERLTEDKEAIEALVALAKEGKHDCQFSMATLLVNLMNAYEKQEVMPEMLELAKFAKHHIPEDHELDDPDFVDKRVFALANMGISSALVSLSTTKSDNVRELLSRVLNAICGHPELRGLVVQQGGAKCLVKMALEGTDKGKKQAAQALARIGITQDPNIAFPGQRTIDVIRPICQLLHPDCDGLSNFEALMCLGNLASVSDAARKRILSESCFVSDIEAYMFEDHQLIRRAAVQCFSNLCASELQVKRCEGKNDKVKYCVLLCGDEEDVEVVKAAAGALAMLTDQSTKVCSKVFDTSQWTECLLNVLANENLEIVLRGCHVVRNLIRASKEIAEKIVETQIMDCLQAHVFKAKLDEGSYEKNATLQQLRPVAEEALQLAHNHGVIKTRAEADEEQRHSDEDL